MTADFELVLAVGVEGGGPRLTDLEAGKVKNSKVGSLLLSLVLVGMASCGGPDGSGSTQPEMPRATTITISPSSVTLSFLDATRPLTATVRDQNGQTFSGTVAWSSDEPLVVGVDGTGLVRALKNGTATVTARSGSVSATVAVTVQQAAALLVIVSGDGQSATVGQALAEAVVVRATDAGGAVVEGLSLAFVVQESGGTVGASPVTTDEEGLASTTWTLGTTAGLQEVEVTISGSARPSVKISATGLAAAAAALVGSSGDLQVGAFGLPLPEPIVVQLQDAFGNGVAGGEVTFAVTEGGGSANPATVTTGADGTAETTWTMGPAIGPAALTAEVVGFPLVTYTATAVPPAPDLVVGTIAVTPANPTVLETVTVTAPVTNIGTLTTGGSFQVRLFVDGTEAATEIIGPLAPSLTEDVVFSAGPFAAGTRTLSVVADPNGTVDESDEDNNTSMQTLVVTAETELLEGTPITDVGATLDVELLFGFQFPMADELSIEFKLTAGTGTDDADMYVHRGERPPDRDDYECISGAIDSNESCRFEAALAGTYHVLIHAFTTFSGATLTVTTGLTVLPYNIELVFVNNSGSADQRTAVEQAAARWESILPVDVHDISFVNQPVDADSCIEGQGPIQSVVDDIRIYVSFDSIDGLGGALGQAGPCIIRVVNSLPIVGAMQFDTLDLNNRFLTPEALLPLMLHEMGHVLGIGTIWGPTLTDLLRNPSVGIGNAGSDTHFVGPLAIAAFDAAGGTGYTGGEKVPVENSGMVGSADAHWRESVLGNELMTSGLNSGSNPLSAITIQSLADLGYRVDVGPADPFSPVFTAPALARGPVIDLRGDIRRGPLVVVDQQGRTIRVIPR